MITTIESGLSGDGVRVAIACGRFNELITERLLKGALASFARHGVAEDDITVVWVPGAFELPLVAKRLADRDDIDAVIALGAVIRGATGHYDHVAGQCAGGLQRAQLDSCKPVVFGVLTTETVKQALDRAGSKADNKGYESAETAIEMVNLLKEL